MGEARRNTREPEGPDDRPVRLPQRWVLILGIAGAAAVILGVKVDLATGATAGLAIIGLLHAIMD